MTYNIDGDIYVATMYIDTSYSTQQGKTYCRYLLRESYRDEGKVKHRTLAKLSHCTDEEIAAIKLALKHKGTYLRLVRQKILKQSKVRVLESFTL